MKVARYDYPDQLGDELSDLVDDIQSMLCDGHYVLSQQVRDFESAFADFLGAKHVSGVNSGTDALVIALRSLGVGPGDEVITQANTFHATVAAICHVGAKPVLVDAHAESYLMDVERIEAAVTDATRVILPVHLYGKPTPMNWILELANRHNIHVVEDAAQAHGARIHGQRVGTFGAFGCFSFHPSKNLAAAGDAGALCTNDDALLEQVNVLRGLGQQGQNHHVTVGYNSKLDAIQARILSAKLARLDEWSVARRRIAADYRERLNGLDIEFQRCDDGEEHVYHLFQIRTKRRDQLEMFLKDAEVDAVVRYPTAIHLQPAFADQGWCKGQFPVAESLADELLCLPIRPNMSEAEVDYTAGKVREFFGEPQ